MEGGEIKVSEADVKAALDWADRVERGEAQYDPWLVSLAKAYRALEAELVALREVTELGPDWRDAVEALRVARNEVETLTAELAEAKRREDARTNELLEAKDLVHRLARALDII